MIAAKLILLGEIGVGKTSLVRRLVHDELPSDYQPTMGVDLYRYELPRGEGGATQAVNLVIWDIDGGYGESIFSHVYSRGAAAGLIIGDVTRPASLELMVRLGHGFQDALPGRPFSFVLNKLDLLAPGQAPRLPVDLERHPRGHVRTSARTGDNVRAAFAGIAGDIVRRGL